MYITKEVLEKYGACAQGIKFVDKFFPDGIEMIELIQTKHIPHEMLHWGFDHLPWNEKERETYESVLEIISSQHYHGSEKLFDSSFIGKSKKIHSSSFVFNSENVRNSNIINESQDVDDSQRIFKSNFVYSSSNVYGSTNITNSNNIYNVIYALNSRNCAGGKNIVDSSEIFNSENVENSFFCTSVNTLQNCYFCNKITDATNMVFNRPVGERIMSNIRVQYEKFLAEISPRIIEEIPSTSINIMPVVNLNFSSYFEQLPNEFWRWVRSLPGYDSEIMYNITYNSKPLLEE